MTSLFPGVYRLARRSEQVSSKGFFIPSNSYSARQPAPECRNCGRNSSEFFIGQRN
jgi:hypothetical protein